MNEPGFNSAAKWDDKYRRGEHASEKPAQAVIDCASWLPKTGRALDAGGGAGRHALWLAQRGLATTLADISPVALEIASTRAAAAGLSLQLIARDLERDSLPEGTWELVLCHHFLDRPLLLAAAEQLAIDGRLVVIQPTLKNLERHQRPPHQFLLQAGELPGLLGPLRLLHYQEGWNSEGRHEAVCVASRAAETTPAGRT